MEAKQAWDWLKPVRKSSLPSSGVYKWIVVFSWLIKATITKPTLHQDQGEEAKIRMQKRLCPVRFDLHSDSRSGKIERKD